MRTLPKTRTSCAALRMASTRLLFVGCGAIARHHLRALQASGRSWQISAVADPDKSAAEAFLKELPRPDQCEVFRDVSEALVRGKFDAAVLMVPHDLHESLTLQCAAAGKHVLLEKPLAHTLESCVRLVEAAERATSVVMVAENSAYWPEVVKAGELIEAGAIGNVYFAHANYWESLGHDNFLGDGVWQGSWRWDPARVGGGVLMDGGTHWVRPMRLWFGEVSEVLGVTGRPLKASRGETLVNALLRFTSGLTATLHCHFNDIPMTSLPFFQIFGEEGEITIAGTFDGGLSLHTKSDRRQGQHWSALGGYNAAFLPQMQLFLDAVQGELPREEMGGRRVRGSTHWALGEVMVANAIYKSNRTRQWEAVRVDNLL